jgi:hypothetical protein
METTFVQGVCVNLSYGCETFLLGVWDIWIRVLDILSLR